MQLFLIEIYNILITKHLQTTQLRHPTADGADLGRFAWEKSISSRRHRHAATRTRPPSIPLLHAVKITHFFRTTPPLWIAFPIIFFSSARPAVPATVDTQHRLRNFTVDIFFLPGPRFPHTFAVRILNLKQTVCTWIIKALCITRWRN